MDRVEDKVTLGTRTLQYRGSDLHIAGPQDDAYFKGVGLSRAGDPAFHYVAEKLLPPDGVVVDVGANIGLISCALARHTTGAIHAIEPSPSVFPALCETVRLNGAQQVKPHNVALGAREERLLYFADQTAAAASHLITDKTLGRQSDISVPVTTLDALCEAEAFTRLDLLKIDVEGFELEVLKGGTRTLERFRPAVFVEFNAFTQLAFADVSPREVLRYLIATFPFVHRFDGGRPRRISNDKDAIGFLHDVLVGAGCVDDLLLSFAPPPSP